MAENQGQPSTAVLRPDEGDSVGARSWEKSLRRIVKSEIRKALPLAIEASSRQQGDDEEIAGLVHLLAA